MLALSLSNSDSYHAHITSSPSFHTFTLNFLLSKSDLHISGAERSFNELALDSCFSEALTEEVLRLFAASVAAVSANWHHHLLI